MKNPFSRKGVPPVEYVYEEKNDGASVFHIRVPDAAMGPELRHLSQSEQMQIGETLLYGLRAVLRRIRERRRGPSTNPRDIVFGRPEDREPFG